MSSKTKIIVLHMKEIIYTAIFLVFALLIAILLFAMFSGSSSTKTKKPNYTPGIYESSVTLNDTDVTVEVAVDESKITSIRISNLDDDMNALYPLLQPTIEDLSAQICLKQSLTEIAIPDTSAHTASLLLNAIDTSLKKAAVQ